MVTVFILALFATTAHSVYRWDWGKGIIYQLGVVQDVWLEDSSNKNNYSHLIVSKHPGYPNKRSLVRFEDLPRQCSSAQVQSAKMYLYYVYAHKPSWHSFSYTPFIPRHLEVHLVKKAWNEAQATKDNRRSGIRWSSPWLSLDGTDAEAAPQRGKVTMLPNRPPGFVEFDIIDVVKSWRNGVPNNGLVIRATNELDRGRDIRFYSNGYDDSSKYAFVSVRCVGDA